MPVSQFIAMSDDATRCEWNQGRPCPKCGGRLKRIWGFRQTPMMHSHWNASVGKTISSMKQFKDELARASDAQTEKTGIEHRYVPVDPNEMRPPDDAGMQSQYDRAVKDGRIEPTKKVL
jgi:hypothetical protein